MRLVRAGGARITSDPTPLFALRHAVLALSRDEAEIVGRVTGIAMQLSSPVQEAQVHIAKCAGQL